MEHRAIRNRWKVFAEHLVSGLSATEAYLKAGYRCTTRLSAQAASSRLRHRPDVSALIHRLNVRAARLSRHRAMRHLRGKLAHLTRILDAGAGDLAKSDCDLAERRTFQNGSVTIRLPDKLTALRRYGELAGFALSRASAESLCSSSGITLVEALKNSFQPHQTITITAG